MMSDDASRGPRAPFSRNVSVSSALRYSLRLLSYRGRSEKELSERLAQKGFDGQAVSGTIERLKGLGYIDDAALAESLKRKSAEIKHFGRLGARNYLRQMGISREIIDEAMGDYDELAAAGEFVKKKLRTIKDPSTISGRRRLVAALQRRGFSAGAVRKALSDSGLFYNP